METDLHLLFLALHQHNSQLVGLGAGRHDLDGAALMMHCKYLEPTFVLKQTSADLSTGGLGTGGVWNQSRF